MKKPITERILSSIQFGDSTCWEWQRRKDRDGYGVMWVWIDGKKRQRFAHRMSFEAFNGEIPPGLQIDHLCMNKSCVNPAHLQIVTSKENTQRYFKSINIDSYCKNGHKRTPDNTFLTGKTRYCKICRKNASAAYRERKSLERSGLPAPR